MRILLAQKLPYLPALNGASRFGRALLEGLAERNHQCRVIALVGPSVEELKNCVASQRSEGAALTVLDMSPRRQVFIRRGVTVHAFANGARLHERLREQIRDFDPDWVVISEDPTYMLLAAATDTDRRRTLFFSQSQATLPFGPQAFTTDRCKKQLLGEAAGILTSSRHLSDYIRKWGELDSFFASIPVYGKPPFPKLGSFDNSYVTMINPSALKGLPIFLELARRRPQVRFAAVPMWATLAADRTACELLPNVTLLPPSENVDSIWMQTRILLVPSLWGEAFGLAVVEAMLRGIPVLASNVGGLVEAKLGVDYLLPVHPIESYENRRDENGIPIPVVPDQNFDPWDAALESLLGNKREFERLSVESRRAATDYVSGLSLDPTEAYLEDGAQRALSLPVTPQPSGGDRPSLLEGWSSEKLAVLASYLKKKR